MSTRVPALLAMVVSFELAGASPPVDKPDYAKEGVVIQSMTTEVAFSEDGSREWRQTLAARVQSEGTLRQLGVLSFSYSSANEDIRVEYVRVKKADGSVVETPNSSIVDTTAEIATSAPTYSDLRQKQIPVKALGVGDVLEYSVQSSQRKPEVPGQFWYEEVFPDDTVVLSQSLQVSVPKAKALKVSSTKLKYETHEDANQRVYVWKYSQLAPSKPQDPRRQTEAMEPLKVSLTTFTNWEEVGNWWGTLAAPEAAVTPAIQEKAKELTAGLSTDGDKARAIYKYVAMKFRYISISFGAGRYRPHTAEEVLANQYGDCKDKHTLFSALLKAAGIQAWPALIGAGVKFDSAIPSPSQFNHVVTVLPLDGKNVWLDTTQEVAPFGLLSVAIRDEQALVIPTGGKPFLLKTPVDPPFRTSESIEVKSSLKEDGTLTGHFDIRMLGDSAAMFRSGFRQVAPAQWQALAQQMSFALNYAGEVSGVELENLDDLDKPFRCNYEYTRKKYSDWENARITPPLPPLGFGPGDEADKPKEPFWAGSPGDVTYSGSVTLPKGFLLEPPPNVSLNSEFADYSAQYSFNDGTFFAQRKMTIKKSKVALDQWANYQAFAKGVRTDQAQFLPVVKADGQSDTSATVDAGPREFIMKAHSAESLVSISLAKLADSYRSNGSENTEKVYSQWKAESASLLAAAIDDCNANPATKPEVRALALELQSLQASDKETSKKLRDQAGEIRGKLTREILPSPVRDVLGGGTAPANSQGEPQHPTLVKKVEPTYSEAARQARIAGIVHLTLVVEDDGTPSSVYLIEGLGFGLDEEAAKAVKQWRFTPGTVDGKAVRVQVRVDVAFKLL